MLRAAPSQSSPNVTTTRRSNRISTSSRANENEIDGKEGRILGGKRSIGKGKHTSGGQCPTEDDEEDVVVVTKKKTPTKRRNKNRIQSSDDEDDDFVTTKPKKSPKKKRSNDNIQTKDEGVTESTQKSPVKRRKPKSNPIQSNKITAYFGKSTKATGNEEGEVFF